MTKPIIDQLLSSKEPSIRYKVCVNVLGEEPNSGEIKKLREEIKESPRVRLLLSERKPDGTLPHHAYSKWRGSHWMLATLADIGYPPGDKSLHAMRDQVYRWLLSERHEEAIKEINGRVRRCGSQESNCVYSTLTLGIADERTDELARRLIKWQWPDGGWNCDKTPEAVNSSYHESIIPLRALSLYARLRDSKDAQAAAERAAELFLKRKLFWRLSTGKFINPSMNKLFYPPYWHYGILIGLKVMAETGFISDERCADGLDLLESRRLPDGSFPAESRYYRGPESKSSSMSDNTDWGGVSKKKMNEWITADALFILRTAGRLAT